MYICNIVRRFHLMAIDSVFEDMVHSTLLCLVSPIGAVLEFIKIFAWFRLWCWISGFMLVVDHFIVTVHASRC